jgi:uncharacterized MAPEG superfamily protein
MTWVDYVPYAALLVAFALIYVPRFVVGREMAKQAGGYDNKDPRGAQAKLEGLGRRALGAHNNGFEAFAPFAAGVLAACQRTPHRDWIAYLCLLFVAVRTLYVVFYLKNIDKARSGMWTLGILATAGLMLLAILGP